MEWKLCPALILQLNAQMQYVAVPAVSKFNPLLQSGSCAVCVCAKLRNVEHFVD